MPRPYIRRYLSSSNPAERARELRQRILVALGKACKRCGFTDERALQIDHKNGGGAKEQKLFSRAGSGQTYYFHVLDHLGDYQLLCANCNWIKRAEQNETTPRKEQAFYRPVSD